MKSEYYISLIGAAVRAIRLSENVSKENRSSQQNSLPHYLAGWKLGAGGM